MKEIKINVSEIDRSITQLNALVAQENSSKKFRLDIVGGGKTINELESIAEIYKNIDSNFTILVKNTISFLSNVRDSFVSSDQKARSKMSDH